MPTNNVTPLRSYQEPHPQNLLDHDVARIIAAVRAIDTDVGALLASIGGKSDLGHGHTVGEITGLQGLLDAKSNVGHNHSLTGLSDVDGGVSPQSGMVLSWNGTKYQPSALSADLIQTGTLASARLPSYLQEANFNALLAGKFDKSGGSISDDVSINGFLSIAGHSVSIARTSYLLNFMDAANQPVGSWYNNAAYIGFVPNVSVGGAPNWNQRLAYSFAAGSWRIGDETNALNEIVTREWAKGDLRISSVGQYATLFVKGTDTAWGVGTGPNEFMISLRNPDYTNVAIRWRMDENGRVNNQTTTGATGNGTGARFVSTSAPDAGQGVDGDIWLRYS